MRLRQTLPRRELTLLALAIVLGLAVRVAYVLATRHLALAGDEPEYVSEGRFIAAGHLFWSTAPFGIAHASAWKAPAYPAWVGLWFSILGPDVTALRLVQAALGPVTIMLTWLLGRRLLGPRVGLAAAFVVALYPLAFQYEELLYPEGLATPLLLGVLLMMFSGPPTPRRVALTGVLCGLSLLVRPTSFFLLGGLVVLCWVSAGWRRGTMLGAVGVLAAVLVVAPWTYRNYRVEHGFLPVSIQDAAAYGTFNADAANDPVYPYAWRPLPASDLDLYTPHNPVSDIAFRSRLQRRAVSYIRSHPGSIPQAFFWNGLSRLWDVRRPSRALIEVPFEGRSRLVTQIGLGIYYLLAPLALVGLWLLRRRLAVTAPLLAIAAGASVVFTITSGTRYRAPLEPLIAILACSAVLAGVQRLSARRAARDTTATAT